MIATLHIGWLISDFDARAASRKLSEHNSTVILPKAVILSEAKDLCSCLPSASIFHIAHDGRYLSGVPFGGRAMVPLTFVSGFVFDSPLIFANSSGTIFFTPSSPR